MGCCNGLDWSEVDQTLGHHPLCVVTMNEFAKKTLGIEIDFTPVADWFRERGGPARFGEGRDGTIRVYAASGIFAQYHPIAGFWQTPVPKHQLVEDRDGAEVKNDGSIRDSIVDPRLKSPRFDHFVPAPIPHAQLIEKRTLESMKAALVGRSITITGLGAYERPFPVDEVTEDAQGFHARSHERNASLLILPESVIHIHERQHENKVQTVRYQGIVFGVAMQLYDSGVRDYTEKGNEAWCNQLAEAIMKRLFEDSE